MIVGFEDWKGKYNLNVSGVIHVGAHQGQEYDFYINNFGDDIHTHWFEPISDNFKILKNNLSDKENTSFYNCGLGDKIDNLNIYVDSGNDGQSSSFLKPKEHVNEFPHIKFELENNTNIPIFKLDNFNIENSNMLVIDTQGYELNVLRGSKDTLYKIDYIITEFNTIEMYEGCPTIEEIDSFLKEYGFERKETYITSGNWGDAFYMKKSKTIVIIDCFVSGPEVESKLIDQIKRVKSINMDILLVSNTFVNKEIIDSVDFYIYDKRNQLFEGEYKNVNSVVFYDVINNNNVPFLQTSILTRGLQRHGLSVLVNLFNSVNFVKSLGYDNFIRLEVDDLFGPESIKFIEKSTFLLKKENKKALLLYNHYDNEPSNISFHFMNFNIDYFLEKIPQIRNEVDYINYLKENYRNLNFEIAEQFIYNNLKINGDKDVLVKNGQMLSDCFPDTVWNTSMSNSNLSSKYEGCMTTLFNLSDTDQVMILSYNKTSDSKKRNVKIVKNNGEEQLVSHYLDGYGVWSYSLINKNELIEIWVYESDRLLYVEKNENINNTVSFL